MTELADHIEQAHHAYLKRELPRLGAMVRKVAAVHGAHFPWLLELNAVFASFAAEMDAHTLKEDQVLFPMIRELDCGRLASSDHCGGSVANPIHVMMHEHDDAGRALARMRELSNGYAPPPDACNTFRAMLDGLAALEADTHRHVHKENSILFPKAAAAEARLQSARRASPAPWAAT
jgi:regulator of cell morphogenesis and NO signaling